ncbi:macro domain-containing protein [Fodinibius halophilus]|uniref:Macro domain-containing protein n=1 Tax=Fodinibius halophilus TaxID=1736908 RepID=A0A6M1T117_9BACT|nr:macro domain-containing protein [Fodinibius halophilus]NGP87639.1 macro domain-containing protein [Fodinibius halophilus]
MDTVTLNDVTIELKRGDIASQSDIEAVVNAANAQLRTGGGVAGAIHHAAGPKLTEETRSMAPIKPGEAVISGGHGLPNDYVIHCLGPVYGKDEPEEELLANCYRNSLQLAKEHDISRVAFPSISTGAFGYPMEEAAEVAFRTVKEEVSTSRSLSLIRFVLWGEDAMQMHEEVMGQVFG